jgi:CRISPR-associated protein Cmr2
MSIRERDVCMTVYTAISFAPVQGFIEKSRKLRDLYGASLILSYLSYRLIQRAKALELEVISPGLLNIQEISDQEGITNRILIKGDFPRQEVGKALLSAWDAILKTCKDWLEQEAFAGTTFFWEQDWIRWRQYTWELFWGHGEDAIPAMQDLERRKLRRDWTAINWQGESSSLTGTDAIAWPGLGNPDQKPGYTLEQTAQNLQADFYWRLAWLLDDPNRRVHQPMPDREQLQQDFDLGQLGKYVAPNERLSIPELVKRLVTWQGLANRIGMTSLEDGFKDIRRDPGCWTGWYMGDGDKVGDKLKVIATTQGDAGLQRFSQRMRQWGQTFQASSTTLPDLTERVIYAGGDDFLGVLYTEAAADYPESQEKVKPRQAMEWLLSLPQRWQTLQADLAKELLLDDYTYSVGFVWAGHSVPQRDVLQHSREAEQRAKQMGRKRVTIRVVFNSGQFVQWTCPWDYLDIVTKYCDRDGSSNWNHLYSDWAYLKARHAVRFKEIKNNPIDTELAISMLNFYFQQMGEHITKKRDWIYVAGEKSDAAIVQWIDDLIQVGWQLCSNS